MHIFSKRAAVASDDAVATASNVAAYCDKPNPRPVAKTLWTSEAFALQTGRLVAVRMTMNGVEVALVENGTSAVRWVSASTVMSHGQETQWLRTAKFTPR